VSSIPSRRAVGVLPAVLAESPVPDGGSVPAGQARLARTQELRELFDTECTMTSNLSFALRHFSKGLVLGIAVFCQNGALHAQEAVDVVAYFVRAQDARGAGLARKTKPVDVRPAKPEEIIVTMIKGEGKETQSPPAKSGDMVVRNRCPETGNEQILVPRGFDCARP
jgi:hypothetical protein